MSTREETSGWWHRTGRGFDRSAFVGLWTIGGVARFLGPFEFVEKGLGFRFWNVSLSGFQKIIEKIAFVVDFPDPNGARADAIGAQLLGEPKFVYFLFFSGLGPRSAR